ncbi:heme biosynthesis HemY N-terminal domain-containing protein [Larsenimonas suaedae]|uniref:Heme biosynthesis HemY N-terminal domain-containing protein n=1 Tax=Larsenimonas suaedae TaxID=1851019 RepID=A0ABU1GYG6_9GAMM|nr:heme biosynthesis HemY N-terminal domain-containing protein [Larsenimonas suaedae]MCM2973539.1 tetratricopeptide repeat protein [Larsenimonas suaedae]MDR5897091.1 heme biosynthesis HemY N-terminal domain-containing protein [Larsenimonas suaedae]
MRKLILFIVIGLAVGALFGQLMLSTPGYFLIRVGDTSIQTSFWLGLIVLFVLFWVLYALVRILSSLRRPVGRLKRWNNRTRNRQAMHRTVQGLVALAEGHWKKAEKSLVRSADDSSAPLINYLSAALAAHYQGRYDQSETLLKKAHGSTEGADTAVSLIQAQLMLDREQHEQAVATLTRIEKQLPEHPQVLKLLKQAYLSVGDWDGLRRLMPRLERHNLVSDEERRTLERSAYLASIRNASGDYRRLDEVRQLWAEMPDSLRNDPELVLIYVESLYKAGEENQAERLLRQTLKEHWDAALVLRYGLLNVDVERQQMHAEKWAEERPQDPDLMLTLGRLALRNQQWEKAREYFEASYRSRPDRMACAELARLYTSLGEREKAQKYYRQSVDMLHETLPELPQPSHS